MIIWVAITIAANQVIDVPKLTAIQKSIRDLADGNNKVKKSPLGMLSKISKKHAQSRLEVDAVYLS